MLGPLEIDEGAARLGVRDRTVLAALATNLGEGLSREQLVDALWGDNPPATQAKSIQGCVSRLRKLLGAAAIETSVRGYRLCIPADEVDAALFTLRARRARELLTLRESEHARYVATQALGLWRGRPLDDLEQWDVGCLEAQRLTELRCELEEILVEASLAAGRHREVLAQAASMVETAPLRERRWALLARAQYQAGRQMEALRTLRRIRVLLQRELGLDPSPDLVALEQAILRHDPGLLVDDAVELHDDRSPYPGLTPYGEADSESFFGRDHEVRACLDRLSRFPFLAVVGASGSGKSSLLRAGLLPALRRERNDLVLLTPGDHPMDELRTADPRARSVILVDQAEEAFSLCFDETERAEFFAALVAHTDRGRVVIAIRADHTGELAGQPGLAELVERGLLLLAAMPAEGLRSAIEGPAERRGLMLEAGLADLMVREVEGDAGALPLLSHALRETWLRREGRTLTVAGYQASGGIRGAVAQSAEALYTRLGDAERAQLRELMLRLVVPGQDGVPVRARLPRRQLVAGPAQSRLIEQLVTSRLVTSDDDAVQLAHEALIRAWPRLRRWLDDDLEGQRIRHRLMQATEDWVSMDMQESELYRGARLAGVQEWVASTRPQLTVLEERFLDASDTLAIAEERSAAQLARTRGRMVRRLRGVIAGAVVLLALSLVAGFVAVGQARQAREKATAAHARELSAQALAHADVALGLLLAVAAVRLDDSPQTRAALAGVLARYPDVVATTGPIGPALDRIVRAPDGTHLAAYDSHNVVSLVEVASGRITARYDTDGRRAAAEFWETSPLAFSPDGRVLAIGGQSSQAPGVVLVDGSSLRPLPHQPGGLHGWSAKSTDVAFSARGRFLAASLIGGLPTSSTATRVAGRAVPDTNKTMVWDLSHPQLPPSVVAVPFDGFVSRMALSPDGHRIYLSAPVSAYSVDSGRRLWRLPGRGTQVPLDLSSDGKHLAVAVGEGQDHIAIVDTAHGRVVRRLAAASGPVRDLTFSDDGRQVAAVAGSSLLTWGTSSATPTLSIPVGWAAAGVRLDPTATRAYVSDPWRGTVVTIDLTDSTSVQHRTSRGQAIEFACRAAGRDLTAAEWRTYVSTGQQVDVCPSTAGRSVPR